MRKTSLTLALTLVACASQRGASERELEVEVRRVAGSGGAEGVALGELTPRAAEPSLPAERRERGAKAALDAIAEVDEAEGVTVITISESILFRLGSADLLPTAAPTLDEAAVAIASSGGSRGASLRVFDRTARLAQSRAAAVAVALAARGVRGVSVEAYGGDVDRRVEITVRGAPLP